MHVTCCPDCGRFRVQALLLEHNVRFGDPECQGLLSRLDSDLLPVLQARARPPCMQ
jgi:phosphoribosylamine-glycine ligase